MAAMADDARTARLTRLVLELMAAHRARMGEQAGPGAAAPRTDRHTPKFEAVRAQQRRLRDSDRGRGLG